MRIEDYYLKPEDEREYEYYTTNVEAFGIPATPEPIRLRNRGLLQQIVEDYERNIREYRQEYQRDNTPDTAVAQRSAGILPGIVVDENGNRGGQTATERVLNSPMYITEEILEYAREKREQE